MFVVLMILYSSSFRLAQYHKQPSTKLIFPQDQLLAEMKANRVFKGYTESLITFPFTYKYQPGTDDLDTRPEKKVRAPAWTDRILVKGPRAKSSYLVQQERPHVFKCLNYDSVSMLNLSDHKPVYATYEVTIRAMVDSKRDHAYREVRNKLGGWGEAATKPAIQLSKAKVDFHDVVYNTGQEERVTLTNLGQSPGAWRFVAKPVGNTVCQEWLSVAPSFGLLIPGESVDVVIKCVVQVNTMRKALSSTLVLEDLLVFRVDGFMDHRYVPVHATLKPTCFGHDLLLLANFKEAPIAQGPGIDGDSACARIPKELWRLVNHLATQPGFVDTHRLFLEPGTYEETRLVRECVDCGYEIPDGVSAHAGKVKRSSCISIPSHIHLFLSLLHL